MITMIDRTAISATIRTGLTIPITTGTTGTIGTTGMVGPTHMAGMTGMAGIAKPSTRFRHY